MAVVGSRSGLARAVELLLREERGIDVDRPETVGICENRSPPDLIVVECESRHSDTVQQLRTLRAAFPGVPLLLMTAEPVAWFERPVPGLHLVRVPFEPDVFLEIVRRMTRYDV